MKKSAISPRDELNSGFQVFVFDQRHTFVIITRMPSKVKKGRIYMDFKNHKDKEMYCFLLVLGKYASGEITQGAFMQYIDDHTPEEYKGRAAKDNRSRAEVRKQIVDDIEKIQEHIRSTYFGGVRS